MGVVLLRQTPILNILVISHSPLHYHTTALHRQEPGSSEQAERRGSGSQGTGQAAGGPGEGEYSV